MSVPNKTLSATTLYHVVAESNCYLVYTTTERLRL